MSPLETSPKRAHVWEHRFVQQLGIDAPFESIELLTSTPSAANRLRLTLVRRPSEERSGATVVLTEGALCFERVDGATTTFHVRGEMPDGPVDWRFEWPEPASSRPALQITIGLYREPSRPVLVEAVAP